MYNGGNEYLLRWQVSARHKNIIACFASSTTGVTGLQAHPLCLLPQVETQILSLAVDVVDVALFVTDVKG